MKGKAVYILVDREVRGPYGLLTQYQNDLRTFFKQWFEGKSLDFGFTRYGDKIFARCHSPELQKFPRLWREDRINSILDENDEILAAIKAKDNRHTRIERKAWQYYGQVLHLMHAHSMLPDHETPAEAAERSLREVRQSMHCRSTVTRMWLDVHSLKREKPELFENARLQEHDYLGLNAHHLTLPGARPNDPTIHLEGDTLRFAFTSGNAALDGLCGQPVEQVIEHPLITGKGYKIHSATMWAGDLLLHTSIFDDQHLSVVEHVDDN